MRYQACSRHGSPDNPTGGAVRASAPLRLLAATLALLATLAGIAHADVAYVYDALGRLVAVVDGAGNAAKYSYDAAGNLLSISRTTSATLSVFALSPNNGPVGTSVTIYGDGFSATASQNTVKLNGLSASVTSSTLTTIVTSVPAGATTGPISVTAPAGSATSSTSFTVQ